MTFDIAGSGKLTAPPNKIGGADESEPSAIPPLSLCWTRRPVRGRSWYSGRTSGRDPWRVPSSEQRLGRPTRHGGVCQRRRRAELRWRLIIARRRDRRRPRPQPVDPLPLLLRSACLENDGLMRPGRAAGRRLVSWPDRSDSCLENQSHNCWCRNREFDGIMRHSKFTATVPMTVSCRTTASRLFVDGVDVVETLQRHRDRVHRRGERALIPSAAPRRRSDYSVRESANR